MKLKHFSYFLILSILTLSCTDSKTPSNEQEEMSEVDLNESLKSNFEGKIFSVPSPVQMALLLKEINTPFKESILNSSENNINYVTEEMQSLNLGVYGADLGFSIIKGQNNISFNYLSTIENLTNKLGLSSAFQKEFITRLEKHSTVQDSVLNIISDAFKKCDAFLKESERKETSALILTGGWIESMHLACTINAEKSNQKIINRIGEQKETVATIISILNEYKNENTDPHLLNELKDLNTLFQKVKIEYTFKAPTVDKENKRTTLNHTTKIIIDQKLIDEITAKIEMIRSEIVQSKWNSKEA
jgi:hypothetical protein